MLTGAAYPADEVSTERARLADRIRVARSQPAHLAREALLKRIYGNHPYAVQTPDPGSRSARSPRTPCARCTRNGSARPARRW